VSVYGLKSKCFSLVERKGTPQSRSHVEVNSRRRYNDCCAPDINGNSGRHLQVGTSDPVIAFCPF